MAPVQVQEALEAEKRLADSLEPFAGQWIAIRDYTVVDHSDTLRGLLDRIDTTSVDRIFEVAETGGDCFFYPLDVSVRSCGR